jgi:hypothetical protein
VTVTEPRFSTADKEALIASRRAENEPRGSHGWTLREATDPNIEWTVTKPKRDRAAQKLHAAQERYRKQYPHEDHSAFLWNVRPQE